LYKIFGPYLTEITVKQLEDERDTPQLNGKLGNVCKESSEGFVEDTRTYKSIGTHESFSVHKFHSQDMVEIEGNVHHIFSANNIPTFGDKSYGARRRTLVIPFNNRFKPDETFEDKTFNKKFIERFVGEMIKYALVLKEQKYEYKFGTTTVEMKEKYDTEANTAQTYAEDLVANDILGYMNFRLLETDYQNWCSENGYKPSSINVLRKAMDEKGFIRRSARDESGQGMKMYLKGNASYPDLRKVEGRLGLYQAIDSEAEVDKISNDEDEKFLEEWSKIDEKENFDGDAFDGF
jgi:putative DNA primase/helicase